jgi:hypothetical protein
MYRPSTNASLRWLAGHILAGWLGAGALVPHATAADPVMTGQPAGQILASHEPFPLQNKL